MLNEHGRDSRDSRDGQTTTQAGRQHLLFGELNPKRFRKNNRFFFILCIAFTPAQTVARDLPSAIFRTKVEVSGVFPSPPRYMPQFLSRIEFSIATFQLFMPVLFRVYFHRILLTHALALSARQFFRKKNSLRARACTR